MEKENINNYKKILGYIEKIEILSQYMSNITNDKRRFSRNKTNSK